MTDPLDQSPNNEGYAAREDSFTRSHSASGKPELSMERREDSDEKSARKARPHARPDPSANAVPIRSLVDLLTVKGANPARLLREREKGTSWRFEEEDVEAALAILPDRDPYLTRTRQLLHEAIETRDGRFARAAGDFALQAVASDIDGLQSWAPGVEVEPAVALQELVQRIEPSLRKASSQRRTHNVVMIAVDLLSNRRGLSVESSAPVLRAAIGPPPEYARRADSQRRHRVATVTRPRNDLDQLRDFLDVLQPWEAKVKNAQRAENHALTEARAAGEAAADAERRANALLAEVAALRAELQMARQDLESSRSRAHDVRIHASADVTEIRARSVAFLNTRLRDLIATAKEAAEVEPPRTATAVRLLEQSIQELRKEVEWLKSSA